MIICHQLMPTLRNAEDSFVQTSRLRSQRASAADPATRWRHLVDQLDPRIAQQSDWGALAAALQRGHEQGHDMQAVTRTLVDRRPLSSLPAQDLRYRLATVIKPDTSPTTIRRTATSTQAHVHPGSGS